MAAPGGLAEVLARFGPAYRAGQALSPAQAKAWRAIATCRTAALGGQLERCSVCGATRAVYHSCRNRHCPRCQTRAKEAWLAARRRELLPVPYFHLVFTLPHALNGLSAGQPRTLYETLFAAAAAALSEFAASPRWLGGTPAFSLVLHTWRQDLARHLHVHALVAGGALTAAGTWVSPRRGFLFPVKALSQVFRGKFVAALTAARQAGRLAPAAAGASGWRALLAQLYAHDWVVYAKAPLGGPLQVLDYLARYTHRVAISVDRIAAIDATHVAFRVRADARGAKRTVRLPGPEFIGRFLTHVLPPGLQAHPPLRAARAGAQTGPAWGRPGRARGTPACAGGGRVGGRVLQAHRSAGGAGLSALRPWALRRRRADSTARPAIPAQGASVSASRRSPLRTTPPMAPPAASGRRVARMPPPLRTRRRAASNRHRLAPNSAAACRARPPAIPPAMQLA